MPGKNGGAIDFSDKSTFFQNNSANHIFTSDIHLLEGCSLRSSMEPSITPASHANNVKYCSPEEKFSNGYRWGSRTRRSNCNQDVLWIRGTDSMESKGLQYIRQGNIIAWNVNMY
ncbi:uncharacterized protein LOC129624595 isoform X8 [Bubalus kerabau]|uniref:uncharacterized protein LOC129624595 isoform X8 n=1 Tax=Bubalus carabanensis TaxID=3119969 RepID=UPI00244E73B1|nr:uncharacterized protein LOC129624595 isoform X8 [Bubalus carabanensis]